MKKFNEMQQRAIDIRNKNVLVSAGAGSGKTTVLANRVISLLKDGYSIDRMLILTFTNNAALNMKRRIKALIENENGLSAQLPLVDGADISTFDAFSKKLSSKYCVELGLIKKYEIGDEATFKLINRKYLRKRFKQKIEENDPLVDKLLRLYAEKNLNSIIDWMMFINDEISKSINPTALLQKHMLKPIFFDKKELEEEIYSYFYDLTKKYYVSLLMLNDKEPVDFLTNNINSLDYILKYGVDFVRLKELICTTKFDQLDSKYLLVEDFKKLREEFNKKVKNRISSIMDADATYRLYDENKDVIEFVYKEIKLMRENLDNYKQYNSVYSFNDIALKVLNLVRTNSLVREELKSHYQEIMVDEYQDNSDIQDELINQIADNNLFLVGDVKQSIYRFRNANPKLFMKRYELFKKDPNKGEVIDMNKNYRSAKNVVRDINLLFDELMTLDFGGADYKRAHNIEAANPKYENSSYKNRLITISNNEELTKEENEAYTIGYDILSRVKNGECEFKDIAIIASTKRIFDEIIGAFSKLGIPVILSYNDDIENRVFMDLFINLLVVIDGIKNNTLANDDFKHAYISLARSFIIGETDEEIYQNITSGKYFNDKFLIDIRDVMYEYGSYPINVKFIKVIEKLKVLEHLNHDIDFVEREKELSLFIKKLDDLAKLKFDDNDIVEYFNELRSEKIKSDVKIESNADSAVTLSNIHVSKGLEYKHCYFVDNSHGYNETETKGKNSFDIKYGIIIPSANEELVTPIKELCKNRVKKEIREENIRLLYVALTRSELSMTFTIDENIKERYDKEDVTAFSSLLLMTGFYNRLTNVEVEENIKLNEETNSDLLKDFAFNYHRLKPIDVKELKPLRASKTTTHTNYNMLRLGTTLHEILEVIDFKNPDYSFIKINRHKEIVKDFLSQDFLNDIDKASIYKEYQFYDEVNDLNGVIDLLLIFDDRALIVDYKLKNIDDEEYEKQLNIYRDYVARITKKRVECVLYSLVNRKYELVH